jgi:hypothetical protein
MTVLNSIFTVLVAIEPTEAIHWAAVGVIFAFLFGFGYT